MMNTRLNLNGVILTLSELDLLMDQIKVNRDQAHLMTRLQYVAVSRIDPEAGKAWRNRMLVRSRLRKYATKH